MSRNIDNGGYSVTAMRDEQEVTPKPINLEP